MLWKQHTFLAGSHGPGKSNQIRRNKRIAFIQEQRIKLPYKREREAKSKGSVQDNILKGTEGIPGNLEKNYPGYDYFPRNSSRICISYLL
jgi:hypothetical protein